MPVTIPKHVQPVEKHLPDYEVELTVVIGKPAKDVSEGEALDYVLGYTAGNDVSLSILFPLGLIRNAEQISFRYHQMAVSQWNFSKGYGTLFSNYKPMQLDLFNAPSQTTRPPSGPVSSPPMPSPTLRSSP